MPVNIIETPGTTGIVPNTDKHVGIVYGIPVIPNGFVDGEVKILTSINDLVSLDITAESTSDDEKRLFYHVDTFFKINSQGLIKVVLTTAITVDLLDLFEENVQLIGYFLGDQVADADALKTLANALNTKRNNIRTDKNKCLQIILSAGLNDIALYTDLADLSTNGTADFVAIDIAQDYSNGSLAKQIYDDTQLCGSLGMILGLATRYTVKEHIGYVANNQLGDFGVSKAIIPTGDSQPVEVFTKTVKQLIKDKGYMFIERTEGGVYVFNNSRNATKTSSTRFEFNITRPENKAKRLLDLALQVNVNRDFFSSTDGKLSKLEIDSLKDICVQTLENNMLQGRREDFELDYQDGVVPFDDIYIDPNQNPKVTGIINVESRLKFKGVASTINIYSTIQI